ncbi:hypothetical protein THAOC_12954 [Thalassiosira oceanica]|uniref:Uncharacterized protein n=1 Tax=Thalassiosira oceanica TaxID=159749 RepID=K0SLE3_THAOC|nr:hypothetical protein THAOC_12954 [Thalassiosira oceanica]|eukprot:EJK66140.1 hypothetical protein THAOC_12954 [Thalassiosira oceanica]
MRVCPLSDRLFLMATFVSSNLRLSRGQRGRSAEDVDGLVAAMAWAPWAEDVGTGRDVDAWAEDVDVFDGRCGGRGCDVDA